MRNRKKIFSNLLFFLEFSDYGDAWRKSQFDDTPELLQMCETLWKEVSPLYKKLHAFVRMRLKDYYTKHYPNYKFPTDGTIPAHLLGNKMKCYISTMYASKIPYPFFLSKIYIF